MTALELCRQHADLEFAPVLRVIKYLGLDSARLDDADVTKTITLYPHFEANPELLVGIERVAEATGVSPSRIREILQERRTEIPFLGSAENPMVPAIAVRMIRAVFRGDDPIEAAGREWATLEDISRRTGVSVKLLSRQARKTKDSEEIEARAMSTGPFSQDREGDDDSADDDGEIALVSMRAPARTSRLPEHIVHLEAELREAQQQLKNLGSTLTRISRGLRKVRSAAAATPMGSVPRRGTRRRGGGKPNTIVEACRKVLDTEGAAMKVADITARVIESGVQIRAKNPSVTISSILSSYDAFERVRRGYYRLAS